MRNEVAGEPPPAPIRKTVGTGASAVILLVWGNRIQIMLPEDPGAGMVDLVELHYHQALEWLRLNHYTYRDYHEYLSDAWQHEGYTTVTIWRRTV